MFHIPSATTCGEPVWRRLATKSYEKSGLVAAVLVSTASHAGDMAETAFFESRIRPLLVERCYECHSGGKKQKGGLLLDSRAGWEKGGDSGPALVPGNPGESLLMKAVRWADRDLRMPPEKAGGRLTEGQIADLEVWVTRGAIDPRTGADAAPVKQDWDEVFAKRSEWWSLQPLPGVKPSRPGDRSDTVSATDRFLGARMRAARVKPSGVADPPTLIRRATLVLTGLPPSTDEVDAYVRSAAKDPTKAYATLVDRLLESPHFGERFARHWLDVVRFSETHGNEWNYDVPYAWRYRDYVIRAFNSDVPYDQFVREQIAGDLLPNPRWNVTGRFNESAIGTAFYRFGEVNHDSCVQFSVIGYDIEDNQVDTLTKAFQASTVACARCHDHKMDAISTRDYHALLSVVRGARSVQRTLDAPEVNRDALAALRGLKQEIRGELVSAWRADARAIDVGRLQSLAAAFTSNAPALNNPLHAWHAAGNAAPEDLARVWTKLAEEQARELDERSEFNRTHFTTFADFRQGIPTNWTAEGMGLRDRADSGGDFAVAPEGERAVKALLSSGTYTFSLSDKMNGALRSPVMRRARGKVSFEVMGGQFSLTRLVFNNCQLNYNHQHSIHHDAWSWVTIDFKGDTDLLNPYAEILTYWDNPKFPDPLGTLGKDTEDQRQPFAFHSKDPRTWWGVRRIVLHDAAEVPKDGLTHLSRLFAGPGPGTLEEVAARYRSIATHAVELFAAGGATDDEVYWLDWMLKNRLLANATNATPRLAEVIAKYRGIEASLALPTMMPGMADEGDGISQPLFARGDHTRPGELVPRGYLRALTPAGFVMDPAGSGRRELAELIASRDNPLTARVMVNRVWQWVFGRGLVGTPDDFGHMGELPTHPELLDDLAARFMAEGWSVKRLVRSLVLSQAFRSSAAPSIEARQRDPQNLLLSHYTARRGEAEVIRDNLLAVSGRLDPRLYGPSIHPYREKADTEKRLYIGPLDGDGRRSIYLKFQLMEAPHFLRAFNLPGGKVTQGRRDASNVPAQSLALLNDPLVLALAEHWAGRLVEDGSKTMEGRVDGMFRSAFGRTPTSSERNRLAAAVRQLAGSQGFAEQDILKARPLWKDAAHMLFNLKEFIFIP